MVIVTGVGGQLGYEVVRELDRRAILYKGLSRKDLDITDKTAVINVFDELRPDTVIHCAAYNYVDMAEEEENNCNLVNITGTENIASACKKYGSKMMFFSTDYVFDGNKKSEYETNDIQNPLSVYGKSKAEAEKIILQTLDKYFVLRISWLFGINGNNFVKSILNISKEKNIIDVVKDQIGSPTYARDLARLICDMIATEKYGVYQATNEGFCSRSEFAEKILALSGKKNTVNPVSASDYPSAAKRPINSRLSKKSLDNAGFNRLPRWEDAIDRYLKEMEQKI